VVADLPGLSKGRAREPDWASFLRHVERTRLLAHLIDTSDTRKWTQSRRLKLLKANGGVQRTAMMEKPMIVVARKLTRRPTGLSWRSCRSFAEKRPWISRHSAPTGEGVKELLAGDGGLHWIRFQEGIVRMWITAPEAVSFTPSPVGAEMGEIPGPFMPQTSAQTPPNLARSGRSRPASWRPTIRAFPSWRSLERRSSPSIISNALDWAISAVSAGIDQVGQQPAYAPHAAGSECPVRLPSLAPSYQPLGDRQPRTSAQARCRGHPFPPSAFTTPRFGCSVVNG